jgi:hypothetical protein
VREQALEAEIVEPLVLADRKVSIASRLFTDRTHTVGLLTCGHRE